MATVEPRRRRRADGSMGPARYRVRYRDSEGNEKSKSFRRRKDADTFAIEVEHGKLTGSYVDPHAGRITVRSYAEDWRAARSWAQSTDDQVESTFRNHLYPALGDRPIGSLRRSDLQGWVNGLSKPTETSKGLAPKSIETLGSHVASMLKTAALDQVIARSPWQQISLPRVPKKRVVPHSDVEVATLIEHLDDEWRAAGVAGAGLGIRNSELLGLCVDRVDFLRRTVRIDQQAEIVTGEGVRLTPILKTDASFRTIPLPDIVSDELALHIKTFGVGEGGAIFHHADGRLFRRQRYLEQLDRARDRANAAAIEAHEKSGRPGQAVIPLPRRIKTHDLRHFYASMLIAGGASVKTVQKRLGHESAVETLDTYTHLWPDSEEQTRDRVDEVLGNVARTRRASA